MKQFAEVIGDPIARSLSPAIHNHWFRRLGLAVEFCATQVAAAALPAYLASRRTDPDWLGCSVTAPLKRAILPLLDGADEIAGSVGAANCIYRHEQRLLGCNTDVAGIDAALGGMTSGGGKAVVIGAGGAAAAMLHWLESRAVPTVLLVRDLGRATRPAGATLMRLDQAADAFEGAALIVNATPMGMADGPSMPRLLLESLAKAPDARAMDMVYRPLETPFLAAARAAGLRPVDGLAMLIGQARAAFRRFTGAEAPEDDAALRALLSAAG